MEKNNRLERAKTKKQPARQDKNERAAVYNYKSMKNETLIAKNEFPKRLAKLRTSKGISAREMSLSLGQGEGYINNIENGHNLPSMAMFFEVCEYLEISPYDFFLYTKKEKTIDNMISSSTYELDTESKELLFKLINRLKKE